jgi:sulfoxide reductase heme-binding subunit YedZ
MLMLHWALGSLTDPVGDITARTGHAALLMLFLCLACTPAQSWLRWRRLAAERRRFGLYAFFYAFLHLFIFLVDYNFKVRWLEQVVRDRPYALVGLAVFLILLPLAVTSTRPWMRRLGRNWKRLHRLTYLAALLSVLHLAWITKADFFLPTAYFTLFLMLMLARWPALRRQRRRFGRPGEARIE